MGVVCVKINMHNISSMSVHVTFIEQTMPTFVHNMASCMHNISSYMPYVSMYLQYPILHAQYTIVQAQHTNMHAQNANMTYAHTTCQHASTIYKLAICMHNMLLCMHACITSSSHSPKITWAHKGISHAFEKDFEVAREAILLANKCKRQMGEPLSTCQGPWGMSHQISRLYTQVWQFPRAACRNRLGKGMPIAVP